MGGADAGENVRMKTLSFRYDEQNTSGCRKMLAEKETLSELRSACIECSLVNYNRLEALIAI